MRYRRIGWAILAILLTIVGAFAGAVVTGLSIGAETETGGRVLQVGSPLLIAFALLLAVSALLLSLGSRRQQRG